MIANLRLLIPTLASGAAVKTSNPLARPPAAVMACVGIKGVAKDYEFLLANGALLFSAAMTALAGWE
jgi:hypothetical protein